MRLSTIAEILNETYHGEDVDVETVGGLDTDNNNAICYVESGKKLDGILSRKPVAIIVPVGLKPKDVPYIQVKDPKLAFMRLLEIFAPKMMDDHDDHVVHINTYIDEKAYIDNNVTVMPGVVVMKNAYIDKNCVIYPNCVIERDAKIGQNTIVFSGVIIRERCVVGDDCIIHSGAVIGSEGYGYYENGGKIMKIPQIGIVKIGDRVEIGANCCIDRATVGSTEIGDDTKLDNMVHIAHNVKIGNRCYIAAQSGISGSVNIGNHVAILGQVGIADHVSIADETVIMAQSGIPNDIKKPDIFFGTPARRVKEHHKIYASLKYVPDLLKRVKLLEDKLKGN